MTKVPCLAAALILCGTLVSAQTQAQTPAPPPPTTPSTTPSTPPATTPAPATAPAATPAAPAAQTPAIKPDLTGTWTLNLAKSDFDQIPPPQDETIVFSHTGSTYSIATTSNNDRGKEVYTLPFTTDGNETPTPSGVFPDTATLQYLSTRGEWQGASLVLTQKILYQGGDGSLKSTFTLSADGKTLTRLMHISVAQGEFDTTSVFERQPATAGTSNPV